MTSSNRLRPRLRQAQIGQRRAAVPVPRQVLHVRLGDFLRRFADGAAPGGVDACQREQHLVTVTQGPVVAVEQAGEGTAMRLDRVEHPPDSIASAALPAPDPRHLLSAPGESVYERL